MAHPAPLDVRDESGRDVSTDFSPIMGETGVPGFMISTGWGTWGFKAIPAGGSQLAQLIATGNAPLIEPFGLDRFAREAAMADPFTYDASNIDQFSSIF